MDFLKHVLFLFLIRDTISFCSSDPSGIKVTAKSAKSIHVAWDTTKINCGYTIAGYRVYFNSFAPFKTYKSKDVSGATTDNVEIFPIVPGFSYHIYVMAFTANGQVSNTTSINYTHPHTRPAAAPSNIHASKKGFSSLTISWDALNLFEKNGDIKGYQIYFRGPGLTGTKSATVLGESNCQYTVNGLRPNSTYQFILRVINDVGPGPYSSFMPISTLPLPKTTASTTATIPSSTAVKRKITTTTTTTTTIPPTTAVKRNVTTAIPSTAVLKNNTATAIMKSTILRLMTLKRVINSSGKLKTTTLPKVPHVHTAVTTLGLHIARDDKLKPGQIAGIVICCVLTVCMMTVCSILCFFEKTRIRIKSRCIQPINR